jgi:hypothetical protein
MVVVQRGNAGHAFLARDLGAARAEIGEVLEVHDLGLPFAQDGTEDFGGEGLEEAVARVGVHALVRELEHGQSGVPVAPDPALGARVVLLAAQHAQLVAAPRQLGRHLGRVDLGPTHVLRQVVVQRGEDPHGASPSSRGGTRTSAWSQARSSSSRRRACHHSSDGGAGGPARSTSA